MKTLIVFVLSILCFVYARSNIPIEVYELRENNNHDLYVNQNYDEDVQNNDTPLLKLLQPYFPQRALHVDEAANNVIAALKHIGSNKPQRSHEIQNIYVLDPSLIRDSSVQYSEENDYVADKARIGKAPRKPSGIFIKVIPQNNRIRNSLQSALRSYSNEDRTAAPRHKYKYEEDSN